MTCCYQCEIIAYSSDAVLERSFLRSLLRFERKLTDNLRRHIRVYVLPSKLPIRIKQFVTAALKSIA